MHAGSASGRIRFNIAFENAQLNKRRLRPSVLLNRSVRWALFFMRSGNCTDSDMAYLGIWVEILQVVHIHCHYAKWEQIAQEIPRL